MSLIVTGTLNNFNDTVQIELGNYTGIGFTITTIGYTGFVVVEVSYDGGINWFTTSFSGGGTGQLFNFFNFSGTTAMSGGSVAATSGMTHAQIHVTSVPIGNASVIMTATNYNSNLQTVQPGNIANTTPWLVGQIPANLIITATGATGAAVTATLPAVASQFHYITGIEITKYFTAANAASVTPLVVTTTNLPGSLAFTFGQPLGTIGTSETRIYNINSPIKSSVVNTNTTIVCPATVGIIWRIIIFYYSAV